MLIGRMNHSKQMQSISLNYFKTAVTARMMYSAYIRDTSIKFRRELDADNL
jgi:hypothetical protein